MLPQTIPATERHLLGQRDEQFGLSAISLWEIAKKAQLRKLDLKKDIGIWLEESTGPEFNVFQLDAKTVAEAMRLPSFPNRDPADELIVATARVHDLILLTTDRALRTYKHARIHYFKPVAQSESQASGPLR